MHLHDSVVGSRQYQLLQAVLLKAALQDGKLGRREESIEEKREADQWSSAKEGALV